MPRKVRETISPSLDKKELGQLRFAARHAVELFIQAVLDHGDNAARAEAWADRNALARQLWQEVLVVAYRLIFIFNLGASLSSAHALARSMRKARGHPANAEGLEAKLRETFRRLGVEIGGALFDAGSTATLDGLRWGDEAAAAMVSGLSTFRGGRPIPYGTLAAEELGRIYESLLELEPGLATKPMVRLRRDPIEVIVPESEGERFRPQRTSAKAATIKWVESIPAGRFYLGAGLGRKTSGSYYTPRPLVRFLVQETLGPLVRAQSPREAPSPSKILELKVLDPAVGSGHFLVEACRYLGDELYDAWRQCDELRKKKERELGRALSSKPTDSPPDALEPFRLGTSMVTASAGPLIERLADTTTAKRICRRLIASRCLYGVDLNPMALELTKLSLWLETYVEGLPLIPLELRLLHGDSLTGPFLRHLFDDDSHQPEPALVGRLQRLLSEAAALQRQYERTTVTAPTARETSLREHRERLAALLDPWKQYAAAWSGAVMLGEKSPGRRVRPLSQALLTGRCVDDVVASSPDLRRLVSVGRSGVPFELAFPEVFMRAGDGQVTGGDRTAGFDAVLGNPPWDKVLPLEREFYARYDVSLLTVPTARERKPIYEKLREDPSIREAWKAYAEPFAWTRRFVDRAYRWQVMPVVTGHTRRQTSGHGDRYRYFLERSVECLSDGGRLGMVLPNSVYSAEGATGVRHLLLQDNALETCLGFVNRKGLFEIGHGQRFCLVVAQRGARTRAFKARFGLDDPASLGKGSSAALEVPLELLERTSPGFLCFPEVSSSRELAVLTTLYGPRSTLFGEALAAMGVTLYQEMNMTTDSGRFSRTRDVLEAEGLPIDADPRLEPFRSRLLDAGWLVVHEKGTFHSFDDLVKTHPRYLCHRSRLTERTSAQRPKTKALDAQAHFRLVFRSAIHATEPEKAVVCMIPPGAVVGNSALTESAPAGRSWEQALVLMGVCNSRCFNFVARRRLGTNLNQFLLESFPFPPLSAAEQAYIAHESLQMICNHEAYQRLWAALGKGRSRRRSGAVPDEPGFPVLASPRKRRRARARIDALVARAYGLDRQGYEQVLALFTDRAELIETNHRCLEAFDELVPWKRNYCDKFSASWSKTGPAV